MTRRAGRVPRVAACVAAALLVAVRVASAADGFEAQRADMVRAVARMAEAAGAETGRPHLSAPVMEALARVPRHEFVPPPLRELAYLNRPLPIGEGQTISQPYIVALMTDLLGVAPGARVLEVGTGSGYQAAVLAQMGVTVFSIEIVEALAASARDRLERLGVDGVTVRAGDGYHGWPEHAPFDGIVVTAAAPHVPQPLVEQLRVGAVLVIPVGPQGGAQQLLVIAKRADGGVDTRAVLPVRFVPLTGAH
jgi:protein-L-isoaspartate(D-aspartate) O-methyltransferase